MKVQAEIGTFKGCNGRALGRADEVAKAVVFLGSEDRRYITGTELFVEGGIRTVLTQSCIR
jgi:NAD(P)-dependent dehydrogenase (short-subunit alcohol dehydrogenase family)